MSAIRQEPTPDLQPETLSTLSAMMLAQAQDCFCRKAMAGRWRCCVDSIRRFIEEWRFDVSTLVIHFCSILIILPMSAESPNDLRTVS